MIYRKLIEKKNIDFDFFKRNAPLVLWNDEKKYFNLVGCKHRTSFLAYQGYDFLICKIANSDFKKWINEDILTKFIDKYEEKEIRNIDILHPFFYEKSDITSSFDKEIYKRILIFLSESLYNRYGKVDFSKMKILDLNFDSGFFSLAISKMVKVVDKVIFNKREASLLEDLKKLLYIDNLKLISKPKQLYQYDIVVTNYIDFLLMMKSFDLKNNKYIIIKFPLKDNGERKKNIDEKMLGYSYFSVISFFSENDFWEIGVYIYD